MINVLLAHVCLTEFVVLLLHAIRQILVHIVTACGRRNPLHMQNNEKICWKKSSEALGWLSAVITSVSVGGKWEIRYLKKAHTNENVLRGN